MPKRFSGNPFSKIRPKDVFGIFATSEGIEALKLLSEPNKSIDSQKFQRWSPIITKLKEKVKDKSENTLEDLKNAQKRYTMAKKSRRDAHEEILTDEQLRILFDYVGPFDNPVLLTKNRSGAKRKLIQGNEDDFKDTEQALSSINSDIVNLKKEIKDSAAKLRELKKQRTALKAQQSKVLKNMKASKHYDVKKEEIVCDNDSDIEMEIWEAP